MHPSNKVSAENIDGVFTFHPATAEQEVGYLEIRSSAKRLVASILRHAPECADQSAAIRKVREAVMTANAAIALG